MSGPRPPGEARHVMFDLDGTLVDTRAAVEACYARVFERHLTIPFPPPDLPADLFAMRPREVFGLVAPGEVDRLYDAYSAAYPDCAAFVQVFPGAADLIAGLRAAGRVPSLVTNKGKERTLIDLSVAGIDPADLAAIVTAEDTVERKPDPAPIVLGLARAGAEPDEAVYVGDGPQDIEAARAAGLACVAVSYGFYSSETLAALHPAALVDDVPALAAALSVTLRQGSAA